MGKRLLRIRMAEVSERLPGLLQTEMDIVLTSGRTVHGRLLDLADGKVVVRDNIGHRHLLAVSDIDEVIYDHPALF